MKNEITIVTRDLTLGGGGVYTQGLVKMFLNDGYKVNLIAPDNVFGNNVNFIKIKLVGNFFISREFFFFFQARKKILDNGLQNTIILSQFNLYSKSFKNVIQFIHFQHFGQLEALKNEKINFKFFIGYIFHNLYKILDYLSIKYAKKVIFISKKTFEKSKIIYPNYKNKFYHIPNFIEIDKINGNNINENKEPKLLLFVGRLEPLKGIDKLCKIIDKNKIKLNNEIGSFKLLIAGDGVLKKHIVKYDFVEYLGKLEKKEIIELYRKSDLFIFPSLYENFPTVVLEAMNYGNLILSRNVGDVEFILSNRNYQIFNDDNEIIYKISKLLNLSYKSKNSILVDNKKMIEKFNIKDIYFKIKKLIYEN